MCENKERGFTNKDIDDVITGLRAITKLCQLHYGHYYYGADCSYCPLQTEELDCMMTTKRFDRKRIESYKIKEEEE